MALATKEDVAARLGRELDDAALILLVETRLNDAERMLKRRITDLLDKALADADYEAEVIRVESDMVLRLVRNPDGYSQESDGNYSYAIYQRVASGVLEVLDEEWEALGLTGGGMFVIKPYIYDSPWSTEGAYDATKPWPPPWWEDC
jgi:hypothetical protein